MQKALMGNRLAEDRRTLKDIQTYPTPQKLYQQVVSAPGWPYKNNVERYQKRDRALVSLLYLLACRISEARRLIRKQFVMGEENDRLVVDSIKLSKPRKKGKPRRHEFRSEAWLPLKGERAPLTRLVMDYLELLGPEDKLFSFGNSRALQITHAILGIPNHWLRAYGEDYLYETWDHDILAVADYVKVEPRTLQEYIRKRYEKYQAA
jgi:integrase